MNKYTINKIFIICVLSVLLVTIGCNNEPSDYGIEALNWTLFNKINISDNILRIQETYPDAIRHQFTIIKSKHIYKYFHIYVASKPDINHLFSVGLLFKDGYLIKFINPLSVKCKTEEVLYEGTPGRKRKSWEIDDSYSINSVLTLKGVHKNVFKNKLTDTTDYNKGMEPLKILPAFAVFYVLLVPLIIKSKKQYVLNKQFLKEYDSSKINIGMTIKEVDDIYGKPQKVFNLDSNEEVRLYGSSTNLDLVYYRVRYSWFAVIFKKGKVVKVLNNAFFNEDWKNGKNLDAIEEHDN